MEVEQSPAELLAGFDQELPGLRTADAVDIDGPFALELRDRMTSEAGERSVNRPRVVSKCGQASLEVADVVAACADAEWANYRNSPISSRRAPFGFAPTRRLAGSPSLNMMSVGMLITSNRRAMSGLSSTFTLAMRI